MRSNLFEVNFDFGKNVNTKIANCPLIWLVRTSLRQLILYRCAVVGNVDAGKSTLLGVLTHGELDNGRGYARQKLFRHKHEAESGRTSSVGNDILGFDSAGQVSTLCLVIYRKHAELADTVNFRGHI